jgi:hypothetical protein
MDKPFLFTHFLFSQQAHQSPPAFVTVVVVMAMLGFLLVLFLPFISHLFSVFLFLSFLLYVPELHGFSSDPSLCQ